MATKTAAPAVDIAAAIAAAAPAPAAPATFDLLQMLQAVPAATPAAYDADILIGYTMLDTPVGKLDRQIVLFTPAAMVGNRVKVERRMNRGAIAAKPAAGAQPVGSIVKRDNPAIGAESAADVLKRLTGALGVTFGYIKKHAASKTAGAVLQTFASRPALVDRKGFDGFKSCRIGVAPAATVDTLQAAVESADAQVCTLLTIIDGVQRAGVDTSREGAADAQYAPFPAAVNPAAWTDGSPRILWIGQVDADASAAE